MVDVSIDVYVLCQEQIMKEQCSRLGEVCQIAHWEKVESMMYASVLILGENLVVSKHFFNHSPPRTSVIIDTAGDFLLSYGRDDSGITSLIWRKFWIDMAENVNSFPLTQHFRWSPSTTAFEKNSQTKTCCISTEPVRSGAHVRSLNTSGLKVLLRDGRSTSLHN